MLGEEVDEGSLYVQPECIVRKVDCVEVRECEERSQEM
jgi:hypothetical protein